MTYDYGVWIGVSFSFGETVLKLVSEAKRSWTGIGMDNISFSVSLFLSLFSSIVQCGIAERVQHRVHSSLKFCIVRTVSALTCLVPSIEKGAFSFLHSHR